MLGRRLAAHQAALSGLFWAVSRHPSEVPFCTARVAGAGAPCVADDCRGRAFRLAPAHAAARAMAARAFSGANVTPLEAALLANPPELVPGSPTTSYQVTGNQTLGTREKGIGSQVQWPSAAVHRYQGTAERGAVGAYPATGARDRAG